MKSALGPTDENIIWEAVRRIDQALDERIGNGYKPAPAVEDWIILMSTNTALHSDGAFSLGLDRSWPLAVK